MSDVIPVTIIGGGVIGCATAYELSKYIDDIFLIEQNERIQAENQSFKNAGVFHFGGYYPKSRGPLKARLCVEGNALVRGFCEDNNVQHRKTGKLIVATNLREIEYLENTLAIAQDNGVPGVEMISGERVRELEPNVNAIAALYAPTTGIVNPIQFIERLAGLAQARNAYFAMGAEVVNVTPRDGFFEVATDSMSTFETKILINAAGLYSDKIARMVNPQSPYKILPVRGEAAKFYCGRRPEIHMNGLNVYPAPHGFYKKSGDKADVSFSEFRRLFEAGELIKTVGVHLTPTFDGDMITISPAQVTVTDKEDYAPTRPEQYYLNRVQGFFPNLRLEDISLHQTGIQANLKNQYDFVIERDSVHPNCINLVGISSPGLTSCLAIAQEVTKILGLK